jgi:surface polysaccharide O-acyltransferase-like enzyme
MTRTYCPRFDVVIALLLLILFSVGMIMHALGTLSTLVPGSISPMTYFFFLAFVAVIVLSSLILVHMLFPKRVLIPPPCE